jgi:hypothetical protein
MTIRSFPLLAIFVAFGLATSACTTDATETTAPSEAELTSASLTIAWDDDGRLFIPQFGHDAERYRQGVHVGAGGTLTIENRGHASRRMTVRFDGPPMLNPDHEIHRSSEITVGASEKTQLPVPNSRGRYSFSCPTSDSDFGSCKGVALSDGTGDWAPVVGVAQF